VLPVMFNNNAYCTFHFLCMKILTDILEHPVFVSTAHADRSKAQFAGSDVCQAK